MKKQTQGMIKFVLSEQFRFEVFFDCCAFLPQLTVGKTDRDILEKLFSGAPNLTEIRIALCIFLILSFFSHQYPFAVLTSPG